MTEKQVFTVEAEIRDLLKGTNYEYVNLGWKGTMYFISFKSENGNVEELYEILKKSTYFGHRLQRAIKVDIDSLRNEPDGQYKHDSIKMHIPECDEMSAEEVERELDDLRDKAYIAYFFAPAGV